jgi:plasmid stabilization system protein ParE
MRVVFRPEARADALEARDWYEVRAASLGVEFVKALDAAIAAAAGNPKAFVAVEGEFRRVILRKFPYSLIFRTDVRGMIVFAVFHHRRHPHSWSRPSGAL